MLFQSFANIIKGGIFPSESEYTNAASISTEKSKYTVNAGETLTVKAETVLADPARKLMTNKYTPEFRYLSDGKSVATVSEDGIVTGISEGTCYVWVYSRNGLGVKVKVTVK
ncbi:MAG: Ig-like domain-containing protein [Lachnospiraceae bacterium]|nr:Ig-like domain-containing protein [Lachnospiraceae bacterium]